jgi:hypothetical protein
MSDNKYKAQMLRIIIHTALRRLPNSSRTNRDIQHAAEFEVAAGKDKVRKLLKEIENDLLPLRKKYEES